MHEKLWPVQSMLHSQYGPPCFENVYYKEQQWWNPRHQLKKNYPTKEYIRAWEILATSVDVTFSMGNRGSPARCHHVSMGALPPRFVVTPEMEPSLYWLQQSHHWQPSLPRSQVVIHDQYSWSIIVGHLPVTWPKLLISGQGFNSFTIDNHLSL